MVFRLHNQGYSDAEAIEVNPNEDDRHPRTFIATNGQETNTDMEKAWLYALRLHDFSVGGGGNY